jgi:DNA-binding PadR family transcriptional regulator
MLNDTAKKDRASMLRHCLEYILLSELKQNTKGYGGGLKKIIKTKYGILLTDFTVSRKLIMLETKGLVSSDWKAYTLKERGSRGEPRTRTRRMYQLTAKGETKINLLQSEKANMIALVRQIYA